ncbi:MAG: hypothetical protein ACRDVP_04445 [Acidimicrobiales bacterium]
MVVLPFIFIIQPIIEVFTISSLASPRLHREHTPLYMLAIPALVPAALSNPSSARLSPGTSSSWASLLARSYLLS